jgi:hypothetical protein
MYASTNVVASSLPEAIRYTMEYVIMLRNQYSEAVLGKVNRHTQVT